MGSETFGNGNKNNPSTSRAFIPQKGSYDKIPETLGKVLGWLMTKTVEIKMPIYGMYYNSPLEVSEDELDWEVGAAFIGELKEEGEIQIKTVPEYEAVSTIFKGPYGEAASVYMDLMNMPQKMVIRKRGHSWKAI